MVDFAGVHILQVLFVGAFVHLWFGSDQPVLLPVFFWWEPVFFFKSTEKAGVIFKTILWKNTADRFAGEDRLAAGMKPLF